MINLLTGCSEIPAVSPGTLVCSVAEALKPPLPAYRNFPAKGLGFIDLALLKTQFSVSCLHAVYGGLGEKFRELSAGSIAPFL
jgi:hypothetical protein